MELKIKVFGVGSLRDRVLLRSVQVALDDLGLILPIEYISSIDEFMIQGLSGIPALKINDTIIADGATPSVAELKREIQQYVNEKRRAS
jgi:hypothetical protein